MAPRNATFTAVPPNCQDRLLRWKSEFDLCDHATCTGQALDVITKTYEEFLGQFTRVADLRARFLEAPTAYMVSSMYYCDRALDGLLQSIVDVRKSINRLFTELHSVASTCRETRANVEKAYVEYECETVGKGNTVDPTILNIFERQKQK